MHDTEHRITVAHGGDENAKGTNIIDLAEANILALHFSPDRIDVFGAALNLRLVNIGRFDLLGNQTLNFLDIVLPVEPFFIEQLGDFLIVLRLQITEGQILKLPLQVANAEPMSQGGIYIKNLAGDLVTARHRGVFDGPNGTWIDEIE